MEDHPAKERTHKKIPPVLKDVRFGAALEFTQF